MGNLAHDIKRIAWVKAESSYNTALAFTAAEAFDFVDLKIQPEQKWNKIRAHVGTATNQGEVEGKRGGKWSLETYVRTNAAGTAPDIGPDALKIAVGNEAVVGGTSVTYSFVDTTPGSLQLVQQAGSALYEIANGAWVEQVDFEINGGDEPRIKLAGGYASHGWVYGSCTVNGAHTAPDTTILLATATPYFVGINSLVKFGAEDNGGAGYRVTAVSSDGLTITISPTLAGNLSGGEAVAPVVPSQTLAGTVRGGIACGLSIGGTAVSMDSAKVSIKTGVKALDTEATSDRPSRLWRGEREVTGEMKVSFDDAAHGASLGGAWNGVTTALIIRAGPNTAGERLRLNVPKARLEVSPVEFDAGGIATATIAFVARQSAAAGDEFTAVFD